MSLSFKYIGDVNPDLKKEISYFEKWLRKYYEFPNPLEIRLIYKQVLIDFDGTECALRFWQNSSGAESVIGEIAVKSFDKNLRDEGEDVAYPTVIAAISRILKYYYQMIHNSPIREDYATSWGDKVMNAYIDNEIPPPSRKSKRENLKTS